MEPRRVQIDMLLIGQCALELNFHSLSASLIKIYRKRTTWLPPSRQFSLACVYSQNRSTRTTNFVEGFHSNIRASYPAGTPTLYEMVKFCAAKLTMANMLAISFGNGSLKDRYIRRSDEVRQRSILTPWQISNSI
uniref:DDE_Tnp_ISL3 domain-containing protein n=1 Tax=Heterorhabditis bacteriophora TaxID=37862 RepID=A0A1I7X6L8_HETBA